MPPKKRKAPATKKGKGKAEKEEKEEQEEEENVEETEEHEDAPSAKKQKPSPVSGATGKGKFGLQWNEIGGSFFYLDSSELKPSSKVLAFDMDGTIINPKSGAKFPKNRKDWVWLYDNTADKLKKYHSDGYKLVIFTNQAGIEKKKQSASDIQGKILDICAELGFPMNAFVAAATDNWRKPHSTMWNFFVENCNGKVVPDKSVSLFIGDAAGRPKGWKPGASKDFSCGDRAFAHNIGLTFKTPEEFFLGEKPAPSFKWDSIDPEEVLKKAPKEAPKYSTETLTSKSQEMVLFVGCPASGKSTFARKYFVPAGYVHVNQDTLKTKDKCLKVAREAVESGKSVVIDNTNPSAAVRSEFTSIAKSAGIPFRCFQFTTDVELAHHLNFYREIVTNGAVRRVPDVAYNQFKSKFQAPTTKEGFSEVKTVPWYPDFPSEELKKAFLERS